MHPKVDQFIINAPNWQQEMELLRSIVLDCQLTEELKWDIPVYTYKKANIVGINGLKDYCTIAFFKGGLLNDASGVLVKPGEHTQAGRQIRFTSIEEIIQLEPVIKAYVFEAIEVEKAGLKIESKPVSDYAVPEELTQQFEEFPPLKAAFEALTPGRQKAYLIYFSEAKQSATRLQRIEKMTERILRGKGLTDCICGLSHRMPNCDGTHKHFQ